MDSGDTQKKAKTQGSSSLAQISFEENNKNINIQEIEEQSSHHHLCFKGKTFFLNTYTIQDFERHPSIYTNFVLLLHIGQLCAIQYFSKLYKTYFYIIILLDNQSMYNNMEIGDNKQHLYIGISLFSLGFLGLFIISLFCECNVKNHKETQIIIFWLTILVQTINILYYMFWILWIQRKQAIDIQWITFDLIGILLYYYSIRQSIIKYYFQNWFIFIIMIWCVILTILDDKFFQYGVGQIVIIFITLYFYIYIIPTQQPKLNTTKQNSIKDSRKIESLKENLKNHRSHAKRDQQKNIQLFNIEQLEQKQLKNMGMNTINTNFVQKDIYMNKLKSQHSQVVGQKLYSQQSFSNSLDGSNNYLNIISHKELFYSDTAIQKPLNQTQVFEDVTFQKLQKNSHNFSLNNNEYSSIDFHQKNSNQKFLNGVKKMNTGITLENKSPINHNNNRNAESLELNCLSTQNGGLIKTEQFLNKSQKNQNYLTHMNTAQFIQSGNMVQSQTPPLASLLNNKANQKLLFSTSSYLQQIQQSPIRDTYPIISFDNDLNIINFSDNLIEQLIFKNNLETKEQNSQSLKENGENNKNQNQKHFDRLQKRVNSFANDMVFQERNFVDNQNQQQNKVLQTENSNEINNKIFLKKGTLNHKIHSQKQQLSDLQYFIETTYAQIIEFYETSKKKDLISIFLSHDMTNHTKSTAHNINDNENSQSKTPSVEIQQTIPEENPQLKQTKSQTKEQNKYLKVSTNPLILKNSVTFHKSPALQGYRKAAIQSLTSNPQFAVNLLNSNCSLSIIKHSASKQSTNELQITPEYSSRDKKIKQSDQQLKNNIQTLNHIPQDLGNEDISLNHQKSKNQSPAKVGSHILPQKSSLLPPHPPQSNKLSIPSLNKFGTFNQLSNNPSLTSLRAENLIHHKSQEEYVQNIYQFEKPCNQNSLKSIIETILQLEKNNNSKQVIYRIMRSTQIQFIPQCKNCEQQQNKNKNNISPNKVEPPQVIKKNLYQSYRKLSDNLTSTKKRFNLENVSIDIIINPQNNESNQFKQKTCLDGQQKEKIRLVFRKDFSANFFENVYFIHSLQEEQNRSKEEVLLVKKLFIDSFQSVSHEFGTALNCINNLADVAQYSMDENQVTSIMKPIRYNSTLIQFLINDILDHHLILQNTFLLRIEQFSLNRLKNEMIELFKLQVEYKKLKLDFSIDPQLPDLIFQDKNRIQSILMTMIRNAVKYTQNGQINIELKLHALINNVPTTPKTAASMNIQNIGYNQKIFLLGIRVCDTGVGLDEEESKKLKHLLNYGFSSEQISKNSLGNGVGGLCVSNLIAIKLSGRFNCGIKFEKNQDSSTGTIFKFFVECQAFVKQKLVTQRQTITMQNQLNESTHHLATIQDDTVLYENKFGEESSQFQNFPSSSRNDDSISIPRINSPLKSPFTIIGSANRNGVPTQSLHQPNIFPQIIHQQSIGSTKNYISMTNSLFQYQMANQPFNINQNINNFTMTQLFVQQNSGAVANSLNSSINNINNNNSNNNITNNFNNNGGQKNNQSQQYFDFYQNEEFQVENLRNNMIFLRRGGASSSGNYQINEEDCEQNESLNIANQHHQNGSISPLQILCGKKSHFNIFLPRTPKNRDKTLLLDQGPLFTISQNNIMNNSIKMQGGFRNLYSQQTGGLNQQEQQQQQPLAKINLDEANIESEETCNQKSDILTRLDALRPKISLNTHTTHKSFDTPQFSQALQFFQNNILPEQAQNEEQYFENSNNLDQDLNLIKNKSSFIKRVSNVSFNTQSFVNRNTRITFGGFSDKSEEESHIGLHKEKSSKEGEIHQSNIYNSSRFQRASPQIQFQSHQPIPQINLNEIKKQESYIGKHPQLNQKTDSQKAKETQQTTQEIQEESDSKADNSTNTGFYNKAQNLLQIQIQKLIDKSSDEDFNTYANDQGDECKSQNLDNEDIIADEHPEQDKVNQIQGQSTFNDKWSSSNKLSSTCCVKILYVDDEVFNHIVMKSLLKLNKLNCDISLNGEDGVNKFKQRKKCLSCGLNSYSLIFMDLNMPVKNGFEATQEIKQFAKQNQWNKVTVITCSAFVDISSKIKAQQHGSDYFISKPIDRGILYDLISSQFQL